MKMLIDIIMKRIYLFNIVAWNYRKKMGFPVCKKENFAGLQAHRKRGKSASASPTPHHTLNEDRSARFTAQPLSALVPRGFSACAWKLSSRLFSRPDWPPLGLRGWWDPYSEWWRNSISPISASWIWIILSHFLFVRECHFFLQCFVTLGPANLRSGPIQF